MLDKLVLGKPEYDDGRSISVLFMCPARRVVTLLRAVFNLRVEPCVFEV